MSHWREADARIQHFGNDIAEVTIDEGALKQSTIVVFKEFQDGKKNVADESRIFNLVFHSSV
jgi:hypothetical protein